MNQLIKTLGGAAIGELEAFVSNAVSTHVQNLMLQDGNARVNFAHGGKWDGYQFNVDPSRVQQMWKLVGSSNLMLVTLTGTPKSGEGNPLAVPPRMTAVFPLSAIYGDKAYLSTTIGYHGAYGSDSSGGYFNPAWGGTIGFAIDLSKPEALLTVGWINAGTSGRTWAQIGPGLIGAGESQDDVAVDISFMGP